MLRAREVVHHGSDSHSPSARLQLFSYIPRHARFDTEANLEKQDLWRSFPAHKAQ